MGSFPMGWPQKGWSDSVNECERVLDVGQVNRIYDRNAWWWFVRGNTWGWTPEFDKGISPLG